MYLSSSNLSMDEIYIEIFKILKEPSNIEQIISILKIDKEKIKACINHLLMEEKIIEKKGVLYIN